MKIYIPKGWRKMRRGTIKKKGDRFWVGNNTWRDSVLIGDKVREAVYIRKNKKK